MVQGFTHGSVATKMAVLVVTVGKPTLAHDSGPCRVAPQFCRWCWVLFFGWLVWQFGCSKPDSARTAVDRVDIRETEQIDADEVAERIATAPSRRYWGFWVDYEYFDQQVLQKDLARIERYYRSRGFYAARVSAARVIPTDKKGHVRVEIVVEEGQPTTVTVVNWVGLDTVPYEHHPVLESVMAGGPKTGERFEEEPYEKTKDRIRAELMNKGFAWAEVAGQVHVDTLYRTAAITYSIKAGPRFLVRSVTFLGLQVLPESRIRRVFNVEDGAIFSAMAIENGKRALLDLGVLADVQVSWQSEDPDETRGIPRDKNNRPAVDLVVSCRPALLRSVKFGGGVEFDTIRTSFHGQAGWEHRNLFGGLRRFSVTAKPGVVLYPVKVGNIVAPEHWVPEGKVFSSLRQPGFLENRTTGVARLSFSAYPTTQTAGIGDVVLGYGEIRMAVGVERPFGRNFSAALFVHDQAYYPFAYVGKLDSNFRNVRVRYPELSTYLDYRDDVLRPHQGYYLSNSLQYGIGVLGGSTADIKIQPESRIYVPLSRRVTLALRTTVGLLYPRNYGQALKEDYKDFSDEDTRDQQLLYLRAFFSGGPSSNRGYPFRSVGPHGPASFLAPNMSAAEYNAKCKAVSSGNSCSVPLGGLTLWEISTEVRHPVFGPLTGAVFADMSDVARSRNTFHFDYLHLSVGYGLRYDTPVGPFRVDAGYRVPGMQKLGGSVKREERDPGTFFGLPMAFSVAIGQAF